MAKTDLTNLLLDEMLDDVSKLSDDQSEWHHLEQKGWFKRNFSIERMQQFLYGLGKFLMAGMISTFSVLRATAQALKPLKALPFVIVFVEISNLILNTVDAWQKHKQGVIKSKAERNFQIGVGVGLFAMLAFALIAPMIFPVLAPFAPFVFLTMIAITIGLQIAGVRKAWLSYSDSHAMKETKALADAILDTLELIVSVGFFVAMGLFFMTPIGNIAAVAMIGIALGTVLARVGVRFGLWVKDFTEKKEVNFNLLEDHDSFFGHDHDHTSQNANLYVQENQLNSDNSLDQSAGQFARVYSNPAGTSKEDMQMVNLEENNSGKNMHIYYAVGSPIKFLKGHYHVGNDVRDFSKDQVYSEALSNKQSMKLFTTMDDAKSYARSLRIMGGGHTPAEWARHNKCAPIFTLEFDQDLKLGEAEKMEVSYQLFHNGVFNETIAGYTYGTAEVLDKIVRAEFVDIPVAPIEFKAEPARSFCNVM